MSYNYLFRFILVGDSGNFFVIQPLGNHQCSFAMNNQTSNFNTKLLLEFSIRLSLLTLDNLLNLKFGILLDNKFLDQWQEAIIGIVQV